MKCFDAEFPPAAAPEDCEAVLGYIGGSADHVWTLEEWQRFGHLRQYPAWGADFDVDGREAGLQAAEAARALGWHDNGSRVIVGDMETWVDAAWWRAFEDGTAHGGYLAVCYGSLSTVFRNSPVRAFVAAWDHVQELGAGWWAKQYAGQVPFAGTEVDYSILSSEMVHHGGIGPRR